MSPRNLSPAELAKLVSFVTTTENEVTPILALSGAPGTGKTTLANSLVSVSAAHGISVATLSLDDVYRTKSERLARSIALHPLAEFRGPPTTHDLALLDRTLDKLERAGRDDMTPLPRFDKLVDDRVPEENWPRFLGRPDLVLLDGWCLGALPSSEDELRVPQNEREKLEDPDGSYRRSVSSALGGEYARFLERVTGRVHFETAWENVLAFREEQESALQLARGARFLSKEGVERFLSLFERVANGPFEREKLIATIVLGRDRSIERVTWHRDSFVPP